MVIRIEQGKGRRDRYALLSERLLAELRAYWRVFRSAPWLFPGQPPERPVSTRSASRAYHAAKVRGGITKRGGIHSLRHHADFRIMPTQGGRRVREAPVLVSRSA